MLRGIGLTFAALLFFTTPLLAQEQVCDIFSDLRRHSGPHQISIRGELFLSGKVAALAASDCDYEFVAESYVWPIVINLRPGAALSQSHRRAIEKAAADIQAIRSKGRVARTIAVFSGRLSVRTEYEWDSEPGGTVGNAFGPRGSFPAELEYDEVREIRVEELPAATELPVIPVCELFKDLPAWQGKRIAVRAEESSGRHGAWLDGDCKDRFVTDGLKWPATLVVGQPAFYSGEELERAFGRDNKSIDEASTQISEIIHGRYNVSTISTYVGTLRVRDQYFAVCQEDGTMFGSGYGHLNAAPAELILEAELDPTVVPRVPPVYSVSDRCVPTHQKTLCAAAATLEDAAAVGCVEKVRELLLKNGIDSKDLSPSQALRMALRNGHEDVVRMLVSAGAPLNPITKFSYDSPLEMAAGSSNENMLRLLIQAGVNVDQKDADGATYLARSGYHEGRAELLLGAGANPNAPDRNGATALMHAASDGYENVVKALIQHGANVNLADRKGKTALMYAAEGGGDRWGGYWVDAIPLLLANGADPDKRDNSGETALDIATRLKHTYAIELLQAAGKR